MAYLKPSIKKLFMKKFLFLTLICSAALSTNIMAQGPSATAAPQSTTVDDATMLKQAKESQVPLMVEKTGLTAAQAERIVEINFEIRQSARALANLSDDERKTRIGELKALKEKKYSEVLTADQITAVKSFYEEMGKNMQKKGGK